MKSQIPNRLPTKPTRGSAKAMDAFYEKLVERNERETLPFLPIYSSYTSLLTLTESLQRQCQESERELSHLRQQLNDDAIGGTGGSSNSALKSALKNETRLRDKLEKLQEEYNIKLKAESQLQSDALAAAGKLETARDQQAETGKQIESVQQQLDQANTVIRRLEERLEESESSGKLADQLADGLKSTIRTLQEENDALLKENTMFSERMVSEKVKIVDQMNELTEMVDALKKENELLKKMKKEEKTEGTRALAGLVEDSSGTPRRNLGDIGVVLPSEPKFKVAAHTKEGNSIRFDKSGSNHVATAGADGVVKVWDSTSGAIRSTLYGSMGQVMTSCDIGAALVVGGATDKTCRVWDQKTSRMVCCSFVVYCF